MKASILIFLAIATVGIAKAQSNTTSPSNSATIDYTINKPGSSYSFAPSKLIAATPVEDQCRTSTCWSYSTLSLLESELIRLGKGQINLSQMYVARCAYTEKAKTYLRMNGNHSFDQGGEGWDIPSIVAQYGIVPESVYTGLKNGATKHDHSEMIAVLKGFMGALVKRETGTYTESWLPAFNGILDAYLGPLPKEFSVEGKTFTPKTYAASLGLNMTDYVAVTSFTHHPFFTPFVIEVPDNWAMDRAYNLPLEDFTNTVKNALSKGYTVAWAADVSEKGFSFRDGLAIVPADESTIKKIGSDNTGFNDAGAKKEGNAFSQPVAELNITAEVRQIAFDKQSTTDDHGMHIVGMSTEKNGTTYFLVKNSWGTGNALGGYFYVSEAYFKYKTISVMLHKDGIDKGIAKKLGF